MNAMDIPYLMQGESVTVRLNRLVPHLADLETQCRHMVNQHKGDGLSLYNKMNDIAGDFYDPKVFDMICWDVWKDDVLTRWWLDTEREESLPIASHALELQLGINKRYIVGIGWLWFHWEDDELPRHRRIRFYQEKMHVLDPRPSPWEARVPLSLRPRPGGHPPKREAGSVLRFEEQRDLEWGNIDALNDHGLREMLHVLDTPVNRNLARINQQRYALVAEWERLAYNWCSVLGTDWLNRADAYGGLPLSTHTNPDLLWQKALVVAGQWLGLDYMAWGLCVAPDSLFLSHLAATTIITNGTVAQALYGLSPHARVVVIQRILEECYRWARPLMDSEHLLRHYDRFEMMRDACPRDRTNAKEHTDIERVVDTALTLFDNMLEPYREMLTPEKKNTA